MKEKLDYLEGLRGLAALVVVLKHLQLTIAPDALSQLKFALDDLVGWTVLTQLLVGMVQVFFNAELAVYLFWFLSAYVISGRLFAVEDPSYVTVAFSKRYFRLAIPVLTSIVFAFGLMSMGAMYNQPLAAATGNDWLLSHYAFDQNFLSAVKLGIWGVFFQDQNPIYNPVLWTIFPEFVGSLFCFVLYTIFRDHRRLPLITLMFAIVALMLQKFWMVTFMLGFFWCVVKYSVHHTVLRRSINSVFRFSRLNVVVWCAVLISSGIYDFYFGGLYGAYWMFHIISSASIIIILTQTAVLQKIVASRYFVWLGRISFGLYVIHFPVLCSFTCWLVLNLGPEGLSRDLMVILLSIATFMVIAELFTRYVDTFSRSFANWFGRLVAGKAE